MPMYIGEHLLSYYCYRRPPLLVRASPYTHPLIWTEEKSTVCSHTYHKVTMSSSTSSCGAGSFSPDDCSTYFYSCTEVGPSCPVQATVLGYYPNLGANAALAAGFAGCALATLAIGIWTKTGWTYTAAVVLGCLMEVLGEFWSPAPLLTEHDIYRNISDHTHQQHDLIQPTIPSPLPPRLHRLLRPHPPACQPVGDAVV